MSQLTTLLDANVLYPAAYTRAKALSGTEKRLHRVMNLLVSTLLIAIPTIPLIGLTVGTIPPTEYRGNLEFVLPQWLIALGTVWLVINIVSFFDTALVLLPIPPTMILVIADFVAVIAAQINVQLMWLPLTILLVTVFATYDEVRGKWFEWQHDAHGSRIKSFTLRLFYVSIIYVMYLAIGFVLKTSGLGIVIGLFIVGFIVAIGMKNSIKEHKANLVTKLTFAALPIIYTTLIWIYWLGGWQVLGV